MSVVFGLLICIAVGSLTEPCGSHLLWLCYSAESDLIIPLVKWEEFPFSCYLGTDFHSTLSAPLPYTYIIPHFCGFVKRFSKEFATFLEKAFVQEKVQFLFTSCRRRFLHRPNLLTRTSCPLDTYIIPHFSVFVKRFLKYFSKIFSLVYLQSMLDGLEPHYHSRMLSLAP